MKTPLPLCCTPQAFELLTGQIDAIESSDALLHGAVAIAMHQFNDVDPAKVDGQLQAMVDVVRQRVRGNQPQALLAHLHDYLFDELGFTGNTDDYYAAENSYLPKVLETRHGLPISLSLLYKILAERLGFRAWGVGLPGHFLCGIECDGMEMLIDPFANGGVITPDEAHDRMREAFGEEIEWSSAFLEPVSHRHWLTRMLQNLLRVFGSGSRYADVAAILEMEMLLWPEQDHLQRDLGLVLARIGMALPASLWLDTYLKNNPDDPQRNDLEQLRNVLLT
jgi:regulator of sirC expression with transglutaminase-like and TPR domain